jgi:hypothetical protein
VPPFAFPEDYFPATFPVKLSVNFSTIPWCVLELYPKRSESQHSTEGLIYRFFSFFVTLSFLEIVASPLAATFVFLRVFFTA